ncbi:hypothetical protein HPB50_013478 [Hyalomma asiaticum]|uniref:Uncharacterized protein n=1 Tax=Hyalomma asiaticum TaxID=266040 RepID=A0ACB7SW42_HYAAI|nr:hypothetical protein HPB50_013478 [Hyalomma asiaticum]
MSALSEVKEAQYSMEQQIADIDNRLSAVEQSIPSSRGNRGKASCLKWPGVSLLRRLERGYLSALIEGRDPLTTTFVCLAAQTKCHRAGGNGCNLSPLVIRPCRRVPFLSRPGERALRVIVTASLAKVEPPSR